MDILNSRDPNVTLNPKTITLGNCCFRTYEANDSAKKSRTLGPYLDNDDEMVNCSELDDDIEIKVTKSGKFLSEIHVAPTFFSAIVGMKGSKKREIETDTDTTIKVPRVGEVCEILITGHSERNVLSARNRIHMLVLQLRDKQPMTHFISIPLVSDEIRKNYNLFREKILNGPPSRGIDETIFQNSDKLHLTITPLVLLDDVEQDLAVLTLQECRDEIMEQLFKNSGKLSILMEGLEIMNDDPADVDVLYAKVKLNMPKYNTTFQKVADQISEKFSKKGLIRKQFESVKIHATLMNSIFRKSFNEDKNSGRGRPTRESFDASFILKKYKNYFFGEVDFNSIHLSIRFSTSDNNYFNSLSAINLNKD